MEIVGSVSAEPYSQRLVFINLTLGALAFLLLPGHAQAQSSQACIELGSPRIEYSSGSESTRVNQTISATERTCLPIPNGPITGLTIGNSSITSSGEIELYVPGQNTVPSNASVLTLLNVDVAAGSGDFVSREALATNINGKLRVNLIGTSIGSGRSITFAPFNGANIDPTEVYFQSDRPLTYDNLTVLGATEVVFGAYYIQTRVAEASDFTLTNSSISSTSDLAIAAGTTVRLDAASSLNTVNFENFGTLVGTGTVNAFNFTVKNGGVLSPGFSIGTLNNSGGIAFETGSRLLSEVDPTAAQKADLVSSSGPVTGINSATIQVEAAQPGLTAQDYAAGNNYTVLQASSIDGDSPTLVAGGSLPALSNLTIANTPTADGTVDIAFTAQPASSLPQNPAVTSSPNASNLAGAVANTTNTSPGTRLSSGSTIGAAVNTLTNSGLAGFNRVHAEPYSSNLTIGLEQLDLITNTVLSHADCRKYQAVGFNSQNRPVASGGIDTDHSPSGAVDCSDRRWWIDTAYVSGDVDGSNGLGTFDYSLGTILVGADVFSSERGVVGVYAGFGTSSMDEHDQVDQDFSTDSYHAGVYGRTTTGTWEFSGLIGYMFGETDAKRNNPSVDGFTGGEAKSDLDQEGIHAGIQARKLFNLDSGARVSTVFGLNYGRIQQGSGTETGGGDFNYSIEKADAESLVASIGVDYQRDFLSDNGVLTPIAFARYEYDFFANKDGEHEVTVTSPIFGTFTQVGQNRGANGFVLGLGLGYQISEQARLTAGYGYSVRSNGQEHGLGANLSVRF
ncbi:autotransporter domain-containing protein [Ruegeria atlantica]|uniref:autotransporter family protein n=1 Tax=Ruegeria atlantica TaxID=81569 RepID=UPI0024947919|nr:autotransporter outer membrane beta-barrel domain-containing protein [Ruegeria atlantica]